MPLRFLSLDAPPPVGAEEVQLLGPRDGADAFADLRRGLSGDAHDHFGIVAAVIVAAAVNEGFRADALHRIDRKIDRDRAGRIAFRDGFARAGERIIIVAGIPFGTPGATNMLRIALVGAGNDSDNL